MATLPAGYIISSRSAKCHRRAAVGHWISLCVCSVVGWLMVYQIGILSLSCSQVQSFDAGEMIAPAWELGTQVA